MSSHDSGTRRHADCLGLEGEEDCGQCASQGEWVDDCDDDCNSSSSSSSGGGGSNSSCSTNITSQVTVNNIAFSHDGLSIVSAGSPPSYHHTSFPLVHYNSFPLVFSISVAFPHRSIQHSISVTNNYLLGTRHLKFWDLSSLNPAASNTALTGTKGARARAALHQLPRLTPSLSLPNAAARRLEHG